MASPGARNERGFTLIELMVTIVVLAIVLALAVPSFQSVVDGSRVRGTTSELITALNTARAHAINFRSSVTLAPQSGSNWNSGWRLSFPTGSSRETEDFHAPEYTTVTLTQGASNLVFTARGVIPGGRQFRVCSAKGGDGRIVSISPFGQVTNEKTTCS